MKNKEKNGIIGEMINYTKKWWLLGCHRRAERFYSVTRNTRRTLIDQVAFIEGYTEGNKIYKGLMHKYNPFVRFRLSHIIWWKKEYGEEELRIKRNTYHDIYEVCMREGYIVREKHKQDEKEVEFPTTSNPKAYNIRGFPLGYFQGLGKTHDKVWFAIGAIIVALIGSSLFNKYVKSEPSQPIINVAPTISTPDVNPIINVYPK